MIWFLIYVLAARTAADSSSRNAVNFSSARTTNRFPSSRCASTVNIVRPLESTAETQPQLQPALLRLAFRTHDGRRLKPCRLSCRTAVTVTGVNGSHVRRNGNNGKGGGQELRGLTRPGVYELARLPAAQLPPLRTVEPCAVAVPKVRLGASISHLVLRKRRNEVPENSWTAIVHNFVIDRGSGELGPSTFTKSARAKIVAVSS
jgi:hypothetical protein